MDFGRVYTRDQLLRLHTTAAPSSATIARLRHFGIWSVCRLRELRPRARICRPSGRSFTAVLLCRYRGRRAGFSKPRHVDRHSLYPGRNLVFGSLNIRSLANKLDTLLDVRRACRIDILCLVETWHDTDSVCLRRLRVDGYQVVDRPRPRRRDDTLETNHGGIAIVSRPGVGLSAIDLKVDPDTFEFLCVRVVSRTSTCVIACVYRPTRLCGCDVGILH